MGSPNTPRSGQRSIGPSGSIAATVEWLRKAVGSDDTTVQLLLPDAEDRLYVLAATGEPVVGGRLRSSRRRQVLESGRSMRIAFGKRPGVSLAIQPLTVDGQTIGLVEIVAPTARLAARQETIDAVVGQSAIIVRSIRDKRASDTALRTTASELRLAADLLRAETPASAVSSAVLHCFDRLRRPVAGLLPDRSGTGWYVVAARGLGPGKRAELRRSVDEVSVSTRSDRLGPQLASRFGSIVGSGEARAIDAGEAVLLVGGAIPIPGSDPIDAVALLLGEALEHLSDVGWARMRNENLDMAIAWTAHELKSPLVAARAALERISVADDDRQGGELLHQTRDELQRLADLVDPLLRWSAGPGSLRLRRADLARIVADAVTSCRLGSSDRIVIVDAQEGVVVRADERELRAAIANVVRNALHYSPPSAPITVLVETSDDVARVHVRDRGPGVSASERNVIFDPFARGTAGETRRGGNGLGLFISRRIVDAHGGTIGLRPSRTGAEFCIEIPLAEPAKEGSLSAS